jgi:Arc/MetJ-type ribon-helix-helix transcriptional regulator
MKLSVSLPDEDVAFLDEYAQSEGYKSRSAVVHRAVRLLRATGLGEAYADAWREGDSSEMSEWDTTIGDGLANA